MFELVSGTLYFFIGIIFAYVGPYFMGNIVIPMMPADQMAIARVVQVLLMLVFGFLVPVIMFAGGDANKRVDSVLEKFS